MRKVSKTQINRILKDLDFKNIHKCMTLLNWTWHCEGVPSIEKLKKCVVDLIEDACENLDKETMWKQLSTGGFSVFVLWTPGNRIPDIEVSFKLSCVSDS